jgi:hypothetical protein
LCFSWKVLNSSSDSLTKFLTPSSTKSKPTRLAFSMSSVARPTVTAGLAAALVAVPATARPTPASASRGRSRDKRRGRRVVFAWFMAGAVYSSVPGRKAPKSDRVCR